MAEQHPITPPPPPERFKRWEDDILNERDNVDHVLDCAWKDGFRAGADQELEACCEWLDIPNNRSDRGDGWLMPGRLRAARRPKTPSLKEQALAALNEIEDKMLGPTVEEQLIRRALEQLDD